MRLRRWSWRGTHKSPTRHALAVQQRLQLSVHRFHQAIQPADLHRHLIGRQRRRLFFQQRAHITHSLGVNVRARASELVGRTGQRLAVVVSMGLAQFHQQLAGTVVVRIRQLTDEFHVVACHVLQLRHVQVRS
jgi:hypothetical protein